MIRSSPENQRVRRGFTLIEMTIACFMLGLLASLMAGAWGAFGKPAVDVDVRCRIAQEASLAAETLSRDLSGYATGSDARLGIMGSSRYLSRIVVDNTALSLCFDSQSSPNGVAEWASPDTVILYYLYNNTLYRIDETAGVNIPIATHISNFQVVDQGGSVSITLTFSYRNFQRTYTLIGVDP